MIAINIPIRAGLSDKKVVNGVKNCEANDPAVLTISNTEADSCLNEFAGTLSAISPNLLSVCPKIAFVLAVSFSNSVNSVVVLPRDAA